jgi:hypothetical protein
MSKSPSKSSSPHRILMRLGSYFEIEGSGWGVAAVCAVLAGYAVGRATGIW